MSKALKAWDLQPTLPLAGNEEIYAIACGIKLEVIKAIATPAPPQERKDS